MVLLQAIMNKNYKDLYLFWYFMFGGDFARRTRELVSKEFYVMLKLVCFYLLFLFER